MLRRIGVVMLALGTAAQASELEWNAELGFRTSYEDNYFHRDDDSVTPDETFFTLYGEGEVGIEAGPGDLEIFAGGSGAFARNQDDADHQTGNLGLAYKLGRTRLIGEYEHIENKVFGEEDDASFFDLDSGEIELRHRFTESVSGRASAELSAWDFDSGESDRDALEYEFKGLLRWAPLSWLALRTSGLWAMKNADASSYDWEGPGFGVAAEIKPLDDVNVFVRYRRRWRSYQNARAGDSNHDRDDTIDDISANLRWQLTDVFGIDLGGGYRHGDSDRDDRNYDASRVTGGIFMTFGND